jgi:hypothetical protein
MAEICVFGEHLFPREGKISKITEQYFIFLSHRTYFRTDFIFWERIFFLPILLTFKSSQRFSSLRTKYNFNTAIISLEALQPLTNVLSSTSNVLILLSRWENHGGKIVKKPSALEGLLLGKARFWGFSLPPAVPSRSWPLYSSMSWGMNSDCSPSRLCCPGPCLLKLYLGSCTLLHTQNYLHISQPLIPVPEPVAFE